MHDFVLWCAQTHDTNALLSGSSLPDWNMAHGHGMSASEKTEMQKDPDTYAAYLDDTGLLICAALEVGQRLIAEKKTRNLQVHEAWDDELYSLSLICHCERLDTPVKGLEAVMEVGRCSDMNRFVKKGEHCSNSEIGDDNEED